MKQELVDFKDVISSLQLLSKKVVPLPQRKSKLKSKVLVDPVCSYKNMQVSLIYTSCLEAPAKFWPCSGRDLHHLADIGRNLAKTAKNLLRSCRDACLSLRMVRSYQDCWDHAMMFETLNLSKIFSRSHQDSKILEVKNLPRNLGQNFTWVGR